MDFRFSESEEAFRQELLKFLDKELPAGWGEGPAPSPDEEWAETLRMRRKLARTGLADDALADGVRRPGGLDHPESHLQRRDVVPGRARQGRLRSADAGADADDLRDGGAEAAVSAAGGAGRGAVVPGVQRAAIGVGSGVFEHSRGRRGDFFRINGSKGGTSLAHRADWMMVLVRTDPGRAQASRHQLSAGGHEVARR